jgi:hypothetical protein
MAGAFFDFVFGIALQFGVQSFLLDYWLSPDRAPGEMLRSYNATTRVNLWIKAQGGLVFLSESAAIPPALVLALLAAILTLALIRAARSQSEST